MNPNICLVGAETQAVAKLTALFNRTELPVWVATSVPMFLQNPLRFETLCIVVDLPGQTGLVLLERLRLLEIDTAAILIVDQTEILPAGRLAAADVLDTLVGPVNDRELLGWIECLGVTKLMLARERLVHDRARPLGPAV